MLLRILRGLVPLWLTLVFSHDAQAAVIDDPELLLQHRLLEQQRQQQIEQSLTRPLDPSVEDKPVKAIQLLPADQCQTIKRIWLYGADLLTDNTRNKINQPYIGRCLDNKDIQQLLKQYQNWYLQQGYITSRVILKYPQSSLDLGNLELYIQEGYISHIILADDNPFDRRLVNNSLTNRAGTILNIHDIDTGVEILNRSFAHSIQMQIQPSDRPAHSIILLAEKRKTTQSINGDRLGRHIGRQKLSFQTSNGGSESTGETLNVATVNRDNLFGINDDIQLSATESSPNRKGEQESTNTSYRYSSHHGRWSYTASFYDGFNVRTVDGTTTAFLSSGDTKNYTLDITGLGFRNKHNKLEYKLSGKHSDKKSYINETLVEVSSRKVSTVDLGASYTRFLDSGSLLINPSLSAGMPWFGAITDAEDIADDAPHAEYLSYKLYLSYQHSFAGKTAYPFTWQLNFNGQSSDTILNGENNFVLGGEYSVRGYKNNILSGEHGGALRNDFILPIGSWLDTKRKHPYWNPFNLKIYYDTGEVTTLVDQKRETLAGYGWGLSYNYRWFSVNYNRAKGLTQSEQFIAAEGWVEYYSASINMTF
ncbi:MAG: POTRA domain-containing protein [Gammaproteobacteria bacterium]|nr:POTRA domain-containing protein [Gammaproteobacteria bacterium]